jgi:aspartyl-tRNA(Asn)/glutamyl-tRNA(Gln) amidotransferase subunit C
MISEKDVEHVAMLARLKLTPDEKRVFSGQLSHILEYIDKLNELDTAGVEPLSHPLDLTNVFRDDEAKPSLARDEALANAPQQRDGFFIVPPVLEWGAPEEKPR